MNDEAKTSDGPDRMREMALAFQRLGDELSRSSHPNPYAAVAHLAVERVPATRATSITTLERDHFTTVASTDEVAKRADVMQYELGSGPCIDAIVDHTIYQPKDLSVDEHWPEFGRRVSTELGLRSMLSYRMNVDPVGVIAGLNFYADEPNAFDDHDLAEGLLLTTHAAQAIVSAHLRDRSTNLERALSSNRDIGTAIGILMALHKVTRDQAFDLLRIGSQNMNRKLHDVALDVIDTGAVDVRPPRPS
jgi:hypothetical protein